MKTLEGFCKFMEEYLDEAVNYRDGRGPAYRLQTAWNNADYKINHAHEKGNEQGARIRKSAAKAMSKIDRLTIAGRPHPEDYTLKSKEEAVYARGELSPHERLRAASNKVFQTKNDAEWHTHGKETPASTSASKNLKNRAFYANAETAAAKASHKINDLGLNADINAERRVNNASLSGSSPEFDEILPKDYSKKVIKDKFYNIHKVD